MHRLFRSCHRSALLIALALVAASLQSGHCSAAELYGLTPGPVELQSAGPLTFGPSGILFVGDPKAAKVYAINTDDQLVQENGAESSAGYNISNLSEKAFAAYGSKQIAKQFNVVDMAVNPETGNAFQGFALKSIMQRTARAKTTLRFKRSCQ